MLDQTDEFFCQETWEVLQFVSSTFSFVLFYFDPKRGIEKLIAFQLAEATGKPKAFTVNHFALNENTI